METERILLRPWRDSDAESLFKWASDPDVGPRAGWPPHKSVQENLEIIRTVFKEATNTWAIEWKETGEATSETVIDASQYQGEGRPIRVLRLEL